MGSVEDDIIEAPLCKDVLMPIQGESQPVMNSFAMKEGISQSGKRIWKMSMFI